MLIATVTLPLAGAPLAGAALAADVLAELAAGALEALEDVLLDGLVLLELDPHAARSTDTATAPTAARVLNV